MTGSEPTGRAYISIADVSPIGQVTRAYELLNDYIGAIPTLCVVLEEARYKTLMRGLIR